MGREYTVQYTLEIKAGKTLTIRAFKMLFFGNWFTTDLAEHVHFYYGSGGFIGIRDNKPEGVRDDVVAGGGGNFRLNLVRGRVEFFGQATPRLALTPGTGFDMGGCIGMRFFFKSKIRFHPSNPFHPCSIPL